MALGVRGYEILKLPARISMAGHGKECGIDALWGSPKDMLDTPSTVP